MHIQLNQEKLQELSNLLLSQNAALSQTPTNEIKDSLMHIQQAIANNAQSYQQLLQELGQRMQEQTSIITAHQPVPAVITQDVMPASMEVTPAEIVPDVAPAETGMAKTPSRSRRLREAIQTKASRQVPKERTATSSRARTRRGSRR